VGDNILKPGDTVIVNGHFQGQDFYEAIGVVIPSRKKEDVVKIKFENWSKQGPYISYGKPNNEFEFWNTQTVFYQDGGYTIEKSDADTYEIFDSLYESEEYNWVDELIDDSEAEIGDVFYVVDRSMESPYPMDYKPEHVRYIFFVTDIYEGVRELGQNENELYIDYQNCTPRFVTYNPKDYVPEISRCTHDDGDGYENTIEYKNFINLINKKYWRKMGNNGYYTKLNEVKLPLKEDMDEILRNRFVPTGTYYFDPPLVKTEIEYLANLLKDIVLRPEIILNPLHQMSNSSDNHLVFIDIDKNTIVGWQNIDKDEDYNGEYMIDSYENVKRWCKNSNLCYQLKNGRNYFITDFSETIDLFDKLGF
jgi:hypothetical protein